MNKFFKIMLLTLLLSCTSSKVEEDVKIVKSKNFEIKTTTKGYLSPYYRVEITKGINVLLEFDFYNQYCLIDTSKVSIKIYTNGHKLIEESTTFKIIDTTQQFLGTNIYNFQKIEHK